jgi:hypothetical protein
LPGNLEKRNGFKAFKRPPAGLGAHGRPARTARQPFLAGHAATLSYHMDFFSGL